MRRFRSRVVTAIVLAILMLGLLGGVANASGVPTGSFPEDPWGSLFPEDPWQGSGN